MDKFSTSRNPFLNQVVIFEGKMTHKIDIVVTRRRNPFLNQVVIFLFYLLSL